MFGELQWEYVMGNRAMVVFKSEHSTSPAVYLHWNGGPESVYTFLEYMEKANCRMAGDPSYAAARFCQIAGNYFGGTLSLGVCNVKPQDVENIDPGDNGIFIIEKGCVRRYVWPEIGTGSRWLSEKEVDAERDRAREHEYNRDGKLLAEIAAVNDPIFQKRN